MVDGSTITMPDTPANQAAYPQQKSQKPGCGFPVVKLAACFCLASGALLQWVETLTVLSLSCAQASLLLLVKQRDQLQKK